VGGDWGGYGAMGVTPSWPMEDKCGVSGGVTDRQTDMHTHHTRSDRDDERSRSSVDNLSHNKA